MMKKNINKRRCPQGQRSHNFRSIKITAISYYSYHIFGRRNAFSTILRIQRLFQPFLVNSHYKIEGKRLSYLRHDRNKLRAEYYPIVRKYLSETSAAVDEGHGWRAGLLLVLHATFIEGDRYMGQQIFDTNFICNKLGHPDIFFTMTCNPKRREIADALLPEQSS